MSKHWMQTNSGKAFDYVDLDPGNVDLWDIAHHLSHTNRFHGALDEPVSVAEHSLLVHGIVKSWGCPASTQLLALLHDAPEAYIGDIGTPLKSFLRTHTHALEDLEDRIFDIILDHLNIGFSVEDWTTVRKADLQALATEKAEGLSKPCVREWVLKLPAPFQRIRMSTSAKTYKRLWHREVTLMLATVKSKENPSAHLVAAQ